MLRKLISLILILSAVMIVSAADKDGDGVYTFDTLSHDFGTIADDRPVSHTFTVTNIGDSPIVITTVTNGGCGCTTPRWTKKPIAPGKTGEVTVTFSPIGRKGEFNRQIRARIETAKKKYTTRLTFSGAIVPSKK